MVNLVWKHNFHCSLCFPFSKSKHVQTLIEISCKIESFKSLSPKVGGGGDSLTFGMGVLMSNIYLSHNPHIMRIAFSQDPKNNQTRKRNNLILKKMILTITYWKCQIPNKLPCVTEHTHEIRVYGLCDGGRFAVPQILHKLIISRNTVHMYSVHTVESRYNEL